MGLLSRGLTIERGLTYQYLRYSKLTRFLGARKKFFDSLGNLKMYFGSLILNNSVEMYATSGQRNPDHFLEFYLPIFLLIFQTKLFWLSDQPYKIL